jgi:hypothetical protein
MAKRISPPRRRTAEDWVRWVNTPACCLLVERLRAQLTDRLYCAFRSGEWPVGHEAIISVTINFKKTEASDGA